MQVTIRLAARQKVRSICTGTWCTLDTLPVRPCRSCNDWAPHAYELVSGPEGRFEATGSDVVSLDASFSLWISSNQGAKTSHRGAAPPLRERVLLRLSGGSRLEFDPQDFWPQNVQFVSARLRSLPMGDCGETFDPFACPSREKGSDLYILKGPHFLSSPLRPDHSIAI